MTDNKKTLKFQMMMAPSEAEVLDDWMFRNRIRSRAEAIRRLTQIALAFEPMLDDLHGIWERIAKADGEIGYSIMGALADADDSGKAEPLQSIDRSYRKLTAPTLELGLHTSKMQAIFEALKSGDEVEAAVRRVEAKSEGIDKTREWVRNSWGMNETKGD